MGLSINGGTYEQSKNGRMAFTNRETTTQLGGTPCNWMAETVVECSHLKAAEMCRNSAPALPSVFVPKTLLFHMAVADLMLSLAASLGARPSTVQQVLRRFRPGGV